jgi:hypothetical protein
MFHYLICEAVERRWRRHGCQSNLIDHRMDREGCEGLMFYLPYKGRVGQGRGSEGGSLEG